MAKDGKVKPGSFVLRTAKAELSLSLYDGDHLQPEQLLETAPDEGWGVVSVQTETVRGLGFTVTREPDLSDPKLGEFHVAATPPRYNEDGNIPETLRATLAAAARVLIMPAPA